MKRSFENRLPAALTRLGGAPELPANARAMVEAARRRSSRAERAVQRPMPERLPPVPVPAAPPPRTRARAVSLQMASGRRVQVLAPGLVRSDELTALARVVSANAQRSFVALTEHAAAIDDLGNAQRQLERQLQAVQEQSDLALLNGLRGMARLDRRTAAVRVEARQQRVELGARARATQVQSLNAALSTLQTTAYARTGDPLHPTNLLLAGSQWLGGNLESVLQRLGWVSGAGANLIAWFGPLLALLIVQVSVGNDQYERFVSGQVTLLGRLGDGDSTRVTVSLREHLASGGFEAFRRRGDVPVSIALLEGDPKVRTAAQVSDGVLTITAQGMAIGTRLRLVWTVDTGAANG